MVFTTHSGRQRQCLHSAALYWYIEIQWPLKSRVKYEKGYIYYPGSYLRQRLFCVYQNLYSLSSGCTGRSQFLPLLQLNEPYNRVLASVGELICSTFSLAHESLQRSSTFHLLFSYLPVDCQCPGDTGNPELKMVETMSAWILG